MAAETLQRHREEIRQLQEELAQLRQQCEEDTEGLPPGVWQPPALGSPPSHPSRPEEELQRLEAELAYLREASGVALTEFSRKTLERGPAGGRRRQYRVCGRCGSLPFQLEFQLHQEGDGGRARVAALAVVMESAAESPGLGAFLCRVEERGSLLQLLRTLASLAEWAERRRAAWAGLRAHHPQAVRLPEGEAGELLLLLGGSGGCQLLLAWRLHVSPEGEVSPRLDLLPRLPEQALARDTRRVTERAPAAFRALLRLCDIEGALESLVRAFVR